MGTHLGSAWGYDGWRSGTGVLAPLAPFFGEAASGGTIGGAQIGYNKQIARWVFGVEADASLTDLQGIAQCANSLASCRTRTNALGTATARLGFTVDQFLLYGKGGLGWAHEQFAMTPYPNFGIFNQFYGSATRVGWTAGLGLEYAFTPGLSAKAEYNYLDFGNKTAVLTDQFGNQSNVTIGSHAHLVKLGLNYHLGEGVPSLAGGFAPAFMSTAVPPGNRNWTGFYVGAHGGGGWGRTDWDRADGVFNALSDSIFAGTGDGAGMIFGGQAGYNWQFGRWVTGIEGEASWSDVDSNAKCAVSEASFTSFNCHTRIDATGSLTGRLGTTYGNLLIYGKAGAAWAHETHDAVNPQIAFGSPVNNVFTAGADTRWGYTVGSGLEYAFSPAWSAKVEYAYANFGSKTVAFTDQFGNVSNVSLAQDLQTVKMGVNYKIGADPAAAVYTSAAPTKLFVKAAPKLASDWTIEAGARAVVTSGRKAQDLGDIPGFDDILSRLTYKNMTGYSAELFARLDHRDGIFVKGNFGLGNFAGGTMNDEDFPPGIAPYSNTVQEQRNGRLRYGGLDVGYDVIKGPGGELGPYIGYRSFYESGPTFGCVQIATNGICATPSQPTSLLSLSETETWRGVAVGLNTRVPLADRWKLEVDAAYLPYVNFQGHDQHWNRPDINPGPEEGQGWGTQIEAIVSYAMTDRWNVGVGGRYMYLATSSAYTQFPAFSPNQSEKFYSERWGGFVQTSYRFGGDERAAAPAALYTKAPAAPRNWTGVYVGGHLGAGAGSSDWADPYPSTGIGDKVRAGGAVAGAQIGVNYQRDHAVIGLEAAGSWSKLEGTFTCFTGFPDPAGAALNCGSTLDRLATFTGRVGYAADSTLYYVKAGAALGHTNFMLNTDQVLASMGFVANGGVLNVDKSVWGWTAGVGIEHALDAHWSVLGEYKYVDLGSTNVNFAGAPAPLTAVQSEPIKQSYHVMTLGVNYRFDWMQLAGRTASAK